MRSNAVKRIICTILTAIILLSSVATVSVSSASDDGINEELEKQGYIGISTEEELKTVTQDFYLKNDIFFTSGIGVNRNNMRIHGNGHTVYFAGGISIMKLGKNVIFQDLKLAGNVIITEGSFGDNSPVHYGPVAIKLDCDDSNQYLYNSVFNVHSNVNVTVIDDNFNGSIGGILGYSQDVKFSDSSYSGTISTVGGSSGGLNVGGLVGCVKGKLSVGQTHSNARMIVDGYNIESVGGLVGKAFTFQDFRFDNCAFDGSVTVRGETKELCGIGGILGVIEHFSQSESNFYNLSSYGNIKLENAASTAALGGIVGLINDSCATFKFEKLLNNGNIVGGSASGGIIGKSQPPALNIKTITMSNTKNSGAVSAKAYAGGFIGYLGGKTNVRINLALNEGAVSATEENAVGASGIVGYMEEATKLKVHLTNSYNIGEISGVNATPLLRADGYSADNIEKLYYTNDIEGEHIGEKITPQFMDVLVENVDFPKIDTEELSNLLNSLNDLKEDDYTAESWAKLQNEAEEARKIMENPTKQWIIDDALQSLSIAVKSLEVATLPIDEQIKIEAVLKECKNLWSSDYTSSSWKKLQDAIFQLEVAKTPTEKREAYQALVRAKEALVYVRDLKNALKKLPQSRYDYPNTAAWMIASAAIASANSVLNFSSATQAEVDAATKAVLDAIEELGLNNETESGESETWYTEIVEGTDDPYMSDFEKLKKAWLDYLAQQGITPPSGSSTDIFPNDIALQDAWSAFLAMQLASTDIGNIGGTSGNGKTVPQNIGNVIVIAAVGITVLVAIIAAFALRRKED